MAGVNGVHLREGEPHWEVGRPEDRVMGRLTHTSGANSKIPFEEGRKARNSTAIERESRAGKGTMRDGVDSRLSSGSSEKMASDFVRIEIGVGQVDARATHQISGLFGDQCPGQSRP